MAEDKAIRLGVIGAGLIWLRVHQPNLQALDGAFTPVAFAERSEARREALAREFPEAVVYADAGELLARPDIEAVLVLTPIAMNAPTAQAALQAGKHVIMEKPIARSSTEGKALIEAARQAGKMLLVTEQLGYRDAEAQVAQIIASGEIGRVLLWDRVFHLEPDPADGPLRYDTTPWRKEANFPLGTLFDGGIHQIAALGRIFGAPETVTAAAGNRLREEYGEYDHVHMVFHYPDGMVGTFSHSTFLPPAGNHFQIYGTEGVLSVENNRLTVHKSGLPDREVDLPQENAYAAMWRALLAAYRSGDEPTYTTGWAVRDVATLEAVDQAIKTRSRVPIARS